jgi:acetyltransferase-like isoleucine patch superfamily enzyme
MNEYNTWFPEGDDLNIKNITETRTEMLKSFLGHIADDEVFIEPPVRVGHGPNMSVAKKFYADFNLTVLDSAIVTIGNRAMIGPNVMISTATHETEVASRRDNIGYAYPITIGAGFILTRDVRAWSVAVGSPARVVKRVRALDKPGH